MATIQSTPRQTLTHVAAAFWLLAAAPPSVVYSAEEATDAAVEVDVYLLAGQSNMQRNLKLSGLPATFQARTPAARFWDGKAFVPLEPGKTKTSACPDEFGPEMPSARQCWAKPLSWP